MKLVCVLNCFIFIKLHKSEQNYGKTYLNIIIVQFQFLGSSVSYTKC